MYKIYHTKGCCLLDDKLNFKKWIMRINLIFGFLFIFFLQVSLAANGQKITMSKKNAALSDIFKEIKKQTGYGFMVPKDLIKNVIPISIVVKNAELNDVLKKCFANQPFTYEISNKLIILRSRDNTFIEKVKESINLIDVTGFVKDENGLPLPGATLKIKGKAVTTKTSDQGFFKLSGVDENDIIVISFLGYRIKEIPVDKKKQMIITMEVLSSELSTVNIINTGYQTLPKERSAGSFAKPNMATFNERTGSMNVLQRLDGLIPGLTINNSPSSTNNPLLIRGLSSINGSRSPLIVVDGMALENGTINSVNPNDVEDITVLKDATSASIWGSRASNGVIVITTKKGKAGQPLEINYDGFLNFQGSPDLDYYNQLNSNQFISAAKAIFNPVLYPYTSVSNPSFYDPIQSLPPHETILYNQSNGIITAEQANAQLAALASTSNAAQISDLWHRNSSLMNHTISARGASGIYGFYGSLAYTKTIDDIPGNQNNSFKLNMRQDFNFSDRIKVYLITDLTNTLGAGKNNFDPGYNFLPYALFKDANNHPLSLGWLKFPDPLRTTYEAQSALNLDYIPVEEVNYGESKTNNFLARLTSGISIKLFDGLNFEGLYGLVKGTQKSTLSEDQRNYNTRERLANFTVAATTPDGSPTYYLPITGDTYTQSQANQQNYTVRNQLTYNKTWNESKHQLSLLAGQEIQDQLTNVVSTVNFGYNKKLLSPTLVDFNTLYTQGVFNPVLPNNFGRSILGAQPYTETELEQRYISYYANASYTYNRKYTANASWRIDKSNLFGTDHSAQAKPVYSFGASWLMSGEQFMQQQQWVQNLSLRATYGITGNSPIPGSAASYDIAAPGGGGPFTSSNSLYISTPANPKLTWETTQTYNAGIDYTLTGNRISGTIDVYKKNTKNLIGVLPVNSLSGYNSIIGNFGDMTNKGIEMSLSSINLQQNNFTWSSSLTMGYNKNITTKLNRETPIADGDAKVTQNYLQGYPAFAIFGYKYAGLDDMGDPQIKLADGTITKTRNVSKPEDIKYMGTFQPLWSGGFSNFFKYKNITLNVNMVYNLGHVMRRDANTFYTNRLVKNVNSEFADRWQVEGDQAKTTIPGYVSDQAISDSRRNPQYYTLADINVVSASYIKIRDLTLAYSIPKSLIQAIKAKNITFRAQLSNVMLWKANKYGIDPEFQQGAGISDATGLIAGARTLPTNQKTITLGAHVTF
jgi:TonB-linked SusC/RagA family outer membrane protein